jgi:lysozyme family protein
MGDNLGRRREFTFLPDSEIVKTMSETILVVGQKAANPPVMPKPDRFALSLKVVRRWEGGLVDHPSDPGGITKWGISLRFLRAIGIDINGDGVIDGRDIRSLNEKQVEKLYHDHFWSKCHCDFLPAGVDLAVFDCGVNQGPNRAKGFLQKALKVKVDGRVGPITLAAVDKADPAELLGEFMVRRAVHYSGLVNMTIFGLGWFRRIFDIYREALAVLNTSDNLTEEVLK